MRLWKKHNICSRHCLTVKGCESMMTEPKPAVHRCRPSAKNPCRDTSSSHRGRVCTVGYTWGNTGVECCRPSPSAVPRMGLRSGVH
eukprot:1159771-Pelagomonas_calceolata.AAC.4